MKPDPIAIKQGSEIVVQAVSGVDVSIRKISSD